MVAYQTTVFTYKIVKSGKPDYIAAKMKGKQMNMHTRQGVGTVIPPSYTINLARGTPLFNKLNENLRSEPKLSRFKE